MMEPKDSWYELAAPITVELPDKGEQLFIYESGTRIGTGIVLGIKDDVILVDITFTEKPRLGHLYYGRLKDAAAHGEAQ